MELKENKPKKIVLWLLVTAIILFMLGLVMEFVLKYWSMSMLYASRDMQGIVIRKVWQVYAEETQPVFGLFTYVLAWMPLMTDGSFLSAALRWIPYLVMFMMPLMYVLFRKKIFLIVGAALSLFVGTEILIVSLLGRSVYSMTAYHAIPYFLEGILLLLMCFAVNRSGAFRLILAITAVLLCALSPFVTAILNANLGQTLNMIARVKEKSPDYNGTAQIFRYIRLFPEAYAYSYWPFFKVFSLLTCALILFSRAGRKNAIQNSEFRIQND